MFVRDIDDAHREPVFQELWTLLQLLPPRRQAAALNALRAWAGVFPPVARKSHRTMTHGQLQAFARHPLVSIGAHSRTHPVLKGLPRVAAEREIAGSRHDLADLLGHPPRHFAYPFGAEDALVRDLVRRAGFTLAFGTEQQVIHPGDHPMALPRFEVRDGDGEAFAARLHDWVSGDGSGAVA
jgi:peptidoglycan/xylan/chitin deacetylase (PgdA/CDA1 family)